MDRRRLPTPASQRSNCYKANEALTCTSLAQKVHNSAEPQIQIVGRANKPGSVLSDLVPVCGPPRWNNLR